MNLIEARKFVHGLRLPDEKAYAAWWDKHKPTNLPRTFVLYKKHYKNVDVADMLGNNVYSRMQLITSTQLLYVAQILHESNVYEINHTSHGISYLETYCANENYKLLKTFDFNVDNKSKLYTFIHSRGVLWDYFSNDKFIIYNIHQLLFELSNYL
jgi:hypothetical protein